MIREHAERGKFTADAMNEAVAALSEMLAPEQLEVQTAED